MKKILIVLFILFSPFIIHSENIIDGSVDEVKYYQGRILEILDEYDNDIDGNIIKYQKLEVLITNNELDGEIIEIENGLYNSPDNNIYRKGDRVILSRSFGPNGEEVYFITDYIRTNGILILLIIFILLAIFIGGRKGLYSLLSMLLSFILIFTFILPQIQNGSDPVLVAIISSIIIIPVTFILSHGYNRKTLIAIIGTFISLIITAILSIVFVNITNLTGTASEDAIFLQSLGNVEYNLKGLLLAGIIIGTLGVMDDITVSQTSIVFQLKSLKNNITTSELFKRSILIGKDHIASMINTLILVYTGASLPLLLLFMYNPRPIDELISFQVITTEIVRTLVGSIGLILAVPITTYLACLNVKEV